MSIYLGSIVLFYISIAISVILCCLTDHTFLSGLRQQLFIIFHDSVVRLCGSSGDLTGSLVLLSLEVAGLNWESPEASLLPLGPWS